MYDIRKTPNVLKESQSLDALLLGILFVPVGSHGRVSLQPGKRFHNEKAWFIRTFRVDRQWFVGMLALMQMQMQML